MVKVTTPYNADFGFYRTKVELKCRWLDTKQITLPFLSYQSGIEIMNYRKNGMPKQKFLSYQSGIEIQLPWFALLCFLRFLSYQSGIEMTISDARRCTFSCFYRTKVELKWLWLVLNSRPAACFYRTKVELKWMMLLPTFRFILFLSYQSGIEIENHELYILHRQVFIVPKWNWNLIGLGNFTPVPEFLSYQSGIEMDFHDRVIKHSIVFIVPKWNWNYISYCHRYKTA